jgi:pimeloyl-ACP methyl ester carboxylesterase
MARELEVNRRHPATTLGHCLDWAAESERRLRNNPNDEDAREDYNFAAGRIFEMIHDAKLRPWDAPVRVQGGGGEWLLTFRNGTHTELDPVHQDMLPADRYDFHGTYVRTRKLKDGLGAPLVIGGMEQYTAQTARFAQGKHVYYGMTGLLRFEGRKCVLTTEDPLAVENVKLDGHSFPLAADFTAPLAIAVAQEKLTIFGLQRLLRPQKYADTARIAQLQPYDASKIPVICVHGLADSPSTWAPLISAMRSDPTIRRRCQFWFFSYPSGYPYPLSAAIMRKQLDAINARYPHHKKEVLIGHSMGGLISRTMITDSGMKLWNAYFEQPPEQLAVSAATRETLDSALIFKHRPEVSRVIYLSTPHRGSETAAGWIGKIGSRLVRAPTLLPNIAKETRNVTTPDARALKFGIMPNSIETLSPNNPFVKAINTIPPARGIPFHSIMGDRGKGGNRDRTKPMSTDGYVPYWSSHLDGARSEAVVPSGHSTQHNLQAIETIRQILLQDAR